MKRRYVQAAALLALSAGCVVPPIRTSTASAPRTVLVRVVENGRSTVHRVPFELYVQTTILSEFAPAHGDPAVVERMLEVQAIISRTYAFTHLRRHEGFDLCATTHCQVFEAARLRTSKWAHAAEKAARQTAGVILWHDGRPATVLYHSDCGGHTSTAAAVWGGPNPPYLVAHADDGAAAAAHGSWQYEATREAVTRALNADPRTYVGARLETLEVLNRDEAGRARRIAIRGQHERVVRGEDLREVLTRAFGARSIRSTWFELRQQRSSFVFEGRGFGHGVGLCQAGALARIQAGADPPAVLQRYFPGTRVVLLR